MKGPDTLTTRLRKWLTLGACLFPLIAFSEVAMPQSTDQSVKNPYDEALKQELERAEQLQKLSEARKAAAEAARAEFDAWLPKSQMTGPEGDVKVTSAGYYAELLAYQTLKQIADNIAAKVKTKIKGKKVIVTDQFTLASNDALWQIVDLKLRDFEDLFNNLGQRYPRMEGKEEVVITRPESIVLPLLAGPAILGAAAEVAAFFRVNREITGRTVTLSSWALLAEMASAVAPPASGGVIVPSLQIGGNNKLTQRLAELHRKRYDAGARRDKIREQLNPDPELLDQVAAELKAAEADLDKLQPPDANKAQISQAREKVGTLRERKYTLVRTQNRWNEISADFDTAIKAFDAFENTLLARPTAQGQSPLESVATVDLIRELGDDAKVLYVGIVSQGAEIEVTKTAWTSGRISYIGGSVVTYFLVSGSGTFEASGTVPRHLADSFKGKDGSQRLKAATDSGPAGATP